MVTATVARAVPSVAGATATAVGAAAEPGGATSAKAGVARAAPAEAVHHRSSIEAATAAKAGSCGEIAYRWVKGGTIASLDAPNHDLNRNHSLNHDLHRPHETSHVPNPRA